MLFQSKWRNAAYIIRPTVRTVTPGYGVQITPGLRAEFQGKDRLFDSLKAQEKYGWSDEERERVEKHLLKHKDFGNGLYLAPGQDIPDDMKKVQRVDTTALRCTYIEYKDGVITQCEEAATPGENRCTTHREDEVRITKGMLSAT